MYSELCETSKMECFEKQEWEPLNISTKHSILDVWKGSEYASEIVISKVGMM